jgi:cell division control protein 6
MGLFDRADYIIRDRDILDPEYEPQEIEERDEEVEVYASQLRPVVKGWNPNNIFIYGDTGIGKTVVTRHVLRELLASVEDGDAVDLNIIELNCTNTSTSYQVAVHLVNEVRKDFSEKEPLTTVKSQRPTMSETGYQSKRIYNELYKDLNDIGGTILIVLDEIDNIGDDDRVLYELPRARTHHSLDAKLGVIGISNDYQFRRDLSPKVKDTLCEEELYFEPYDADGLQNILSKRAELALYDDRLESGTIPLCSVKAAGDSGSARQAIRLLRKSAEVAEQDVITHGAEDMMITEAHVRTADKVIAKEQVVEGMHDLTSHGKRLLLTVATLTAEGNVPARTRNIISRYQEICSAKDMQPLGRRGAHNHISKLEMKSIIRSGDTSGKQGNFNTYELDVGLDSALDALESDISIGDLDHLRGGNPQSTLPNQD